MEHRLPVAVLDRCSVAAQATGPSRHEAIQRLVAGLAQVPKGNAEMVAAAVRTIFAQPDATHVREQLDVIAGMLGRQLPKVETMLRDAVGAWTCRNCRQLGMR